MDVDQWLKFVFVAATVYWCRVWTVQIVTGVVVGVLLLVATVIVIIVVYRKSGYVRQLT